VLFYSLLFKVEVESCALVCFEAFEAKKVCRF